MGKGARVSDRHTAMPAKKNGTAITIERSRKLKRVCMAYESSSGTESIVISESGMEIASANAA